MSSVPEPAVDAIADRWGIPRCDDCGRQAFDSDYQKLGNQITKVGSSVPPVVATLALLTPVLAATEAPVQIAGKVLEKAGYDSKAESIRDFSTIDTALDKMGAQFDDKFEDLQWVNEDGQQLCYVCKDGGPDEP